MSIKKLAKASSLVTKRSVGMTRVTAKTASQSLSKDVVSVIERHVKTRLSKLPPDVRSLLSVDYDPWVYDEDQFVYSPAAVCLPSNSRPGLQDKLRKVKALLLEKSFVKVGQLTFKIYGNEDWLKDRDSVSLYYQLVN